MSAYNTITVSRTCPNCAKLVDFEIQFRYGDTWQHTYRLGDTLRWGGNDVGTPDVERVRVEGIAEPCPSCGVADLEYWVLLERDVICDVELAR